MNKIKETSLRRQSMMVNAMEASPLRRRSSLAPVVLIDRLNDEDERSSRRSLADVQRRLSNIPQGASTFNDSNRILDQQDKEDFQICSKLFLENKINSKNAWRLRIIDILKVMAQQTSTDVQVAVTSLDISAKVYAVRVDDIHSEGLKLASNMARTAAEKRVPEDVDNGNENGDSPGENPASTKEKKKRKRVFGMKNTIAKDPQTLLAPLPKLESVFFSTRTSTDSSAIDNLFTNKIKMNPSGHKFELFSQEKAWIDPPDPVVKDGFDCKKHCLRLNRAILPLRNRQLCAPFSDFHIDEWDPDDEAQQLAMEKTIQGQEDVIVDNDGIPIHELDGSIHDIFDPGHEEGMDVGHNSDEEVVAQLRGEIANIVDFRPGMTQGLQRSEFSYNTIISTHSGKVIDQIWAGPSHWKLKFIQRRPARVSQVSTEVKQKYGRKKAEPQMIDFSAEFEEFDFTKKFKIKKRPPTVDFHKITLPIPDIFFLKEMEHIDELITKPGVCLKQKSPSMDYEVDKYKYSNPNDLQYCPQQNDDNSMGEVFDNNNCDDNHDDNQDGQEHVCAQQNFMGNNLVDAPEDVPKVYVPYALQAKKMDMKKLKTAIWKKLTCITDAIIDTQSTQQGGKVVPTNFSKLYKELPEILSDKMKQELSCPLAFVALLHLCNEQNLVLQQHEGYKDFFIRGPT